MSFSVGVLRDALLLWLLFVLLFVLLSFLFFILRLVKSSLCIHVVSQVDSIDWRPINRCCLMCAVKINGTMLGRAVDWLISLTNVRIPGHLHHNWLFASFQWRVSLLSFDSIISFSRPVDKAAKTAATTDRNQYKNDTANSTVTIVLVLIILASTTALSYTILAVTSITKTTIAAALWWWWWFPPFTFTAFKLSQIILITAIQISEIVS